MAVKPSNEGKTALVLAGGGLTGAVYEIGALRAMDDLLVDRTVNDFDIYVGTSAGAIISTFLANGISPEQMLKSITGDSDIPFIGRDDLFNFNPLDWAKLGIKLPRTVARAASHYVRHMRDMNLFDVVFSLSEALPPGLYDNRGLERYVRNLLKNYGGSNDFRELARELHIIATDLDTGERAVFGRENNPPVPISLAVAASSALPVLYKPVRIGDHDYLDGGLRGNASLDLAIESGARLVICINPLVPFDNSDRTVIPFLGPDGGYLSDKGLTAIASQVGRITSHAGLHYHIKQLKHKHPHVDIVLIEPSPRDYQMAFYNTMRYSARLIIARHGFETVTLKLAEDYAHYQELLARHGIPINQRLVMNELNEIRESAYDPAVIRRVLEESPTRNQRNGHNRFVGQLRHTLGDLEHALASAE